MDENFFQYLCPVTQFYKHFNSDGNFTSLAAPMKSCECNGLNYYGMPAIGFGLKVAQYETNLAYRMEPKMFMCLPRIDPTLKTSMCALGLWNLQNLYDYDQHDQIGEDIKAFAVGQNFIRQYNMTFKFVRTVTESDTQSDINLLMFIGPAEDKNTVYG